MSYLVLARKWRPKKFSDVLAQDHAVSALQNSLKGKKLHQAYLFTGTRGVGKTSIARILTKALNCESDSDLTEPCNECDSCISINEGSSLDFLEVDAASKTGIDETKDLLESISYLPSTSKYKIYLIDEVHQLSKHSFNALLKSLEEPPPHVIFMFATTEVEKIPATIISRCLQLNLSAVSIDNIIKQLNNIFKKEKIKFDDESLNIIAEAAEGSVRDALTISEKAISYCDGKLEGAKVREILGLPENKLILELLKAILDEDTHKSLQLIEENGKYANHEKVLISLLDLIQRISIAQFNKDSSEDILESFTDTEPAKLQYLYHLGLTNLEFFKLGVDNYSILTMTLLKMIAFSEANQKKNLIENTSKNYSQINWPELFYELNLEGFANQILSKSSVSISDKNINISIPEENLINLNEKQKEDIEKAFSIRLNKKYEFTYDAKVSNSNTPFYAEERKQRNLKAKAKDKIENDTAFKTIVKGLDVEIVDFNKRK